MEGRPMTIQDLMAGAKPKETLPGFALTDEETREVLEQTVKDLTHEYDFSVGDFIMLKTNVGSLAFPRPGYPIKVLKVLEAPIEDEETLDASGGRFLQHPDIVCAVVTPRGNVAAYGFASRMFRPYEPGHTEVEPTKPDDDQGPSVTEVHAAGAGNETDGPGVAIEPTSD